MYSIDKQMQELYDKIGWGKYSSIDLKRKEYTITCENETMNTNNWQTLYDKYPNLFENRHKSPKESCLSFGVECGLGWYEIISSVCWMIKQHENNIHWQTEWKQKTDPSYESDYFPVKFDQVKEKYGGLRLYFSGGDDYVEGLISMAEAISYKICEVCGQKGESNKHGWIATLCEQCRNKNEGNT